uniref:ISP1 C-terminal domain-containing protein n=1 Tax=Chromera velia CCMP2878 TaxID=1169474 RepID=A0A0G4GKA1_9ALVE|eukprot:Cvel_22291.t1-p1 / transcript=Cvel_22291.t1 / gene=Cvel_22291 / organism=Chromera_velia_CCMP2878 / gene_product=hypothetical protein / transcript_product=hypothetical protein / location=Cvel_scaffold2177:5793-8446(-) / protein_length=267 / sequence_SO=supercontig / SO=protein_coding / is_pseudo=false
MGACSSCCSPEVEKKDKVMITATPDPSRVPPSLQPQTQHGDADRTPQGAPFSSLPLEPSPSMRASQQQNEEEDPPPSWTPDNVGFFEQMQNEVEITVLLKDGLPLDCKVNLQKGDAAICISFQEKTRKIPLTDIKSVLAGPHQLKRVETKADIRNDNRCAALQLGGSGSCIPVRFLSVEDRKRFSAVVKMLQNGDWPAEEGGGGGASPVGAAAGAVTGVLPSGAAVTGAMAGGLAQVAEDAAGQAVQGVGEAAGVNVGGGIGAFGRV